MNRILKTIVVWLLLLALPVQAHAAAMAGACGSVQHSAADGANTSIIDDDAASYGHHAFAGYGHHRDADDMLTDDGVALHHAPAHTHGGSACGSCPACCIATGALALQLDWDVLLAGSVSYFPASSPLLPGVVLAGLERPPRTFLA